jgi:hypothetical protein
MIDRVPCGVDKEVTPMACFQGPLAGLWPGLDAACLRGLLRPPGAALPGAPATDRAAWAALADNPTVEALMGRASRDRGTPWPTPTAHAWARFRRDGDRQEYEAALFARTARLTRAVVAAAVTLEAAWLDEVADGVVLLLEQSSWCWPAHDDAWQRSGALLPDVTRPFLDLGAGEVVAQLAWLWHVLGAPLEERYPGLGERLTLEAGERVFGPFRERRDWHWLGLEGQVHNWNPWIHGHVIAGALGLLAEPERSEVVALALDGLDRYVAVLPEDGAVDEGYTYWWQGAGRALEALWLIADATGGRLDALVLPRLRRTLEFPLAMSLGGPWFVNYADASARPGGEQPWAVLFRLGRALGFGPAADFALARRDPAALVDARDGLGRVVLGLMDPEWGQSGRRRGQSPRSAAESGGTVPAPRAYYFPSTQVLVAHAGGLSVSAKGGHNGENHNHCDVGTVIVAVDGVPVVVDAGRTTYTAQTFGPERYSIWAMRSEWHNLPVITGQGQGVGEQFRATDVVASEDEDGCQLCLDIAAAYPPGLVESYRRTVRLADGAVTVHDEWAVAGAGAAGPRSKSGDGIRSGDVQLRYLVAGDVALAGPGRLTGTSLGGAPFELAWTPALAATLVNQPLDDPLLTRVWGERLTQLRLDAATVAAVSVTVRRISEQERT